MFSNVKHISIIPAIFSQCLRSKWTSNYNFLSICTLNLVDESTPTTWGVNVTYRSGGVHCTAWHVTSVNIRAVPMAHFSWVRYFDGYFFTLVNWWISRLRRMAWLASTFSERIPQYLIQLSWRTTLFLYTGYRVNSCRRFEYGINYLQSCPCHDCNFLYGKENKLGYADPSCIKFCHMT